MAQHSIVKGAVIAFLIDIMKDFEFTLAKGMKLT